MKKNYKEIDICLGNTIDSVMKELKNHTDLVCTSFNGKMLYSDIDDIDSAYVKITGMTKSDFDAQMQKEHEEYLEKERKHKEDIN